MGSLSQIKKGAPEPKNKGSITWHEWWINNGTNTMAQPGKLDTTPIEPPIDNTPVYTPASPDTKKSLLIGGVQTTDWGPDARDLPDPYNPPPGVTPSAPIPDEPISPGPNDPKKKFEITTPIPTQTLIGAVEKQQPITNIYNQQPVPTFTPSITNNVYNQNPVPTFTPKIEVNVPKQETQQITNNNQSNPVGGLQQNIYNNISGGSGSNQIQPPLPSPSYSSTPIEKLAYETPPITSMQSQYPSYNFITPGIQQAQTNQFQPVQQKDYSYVQNLPISGTLSQYTGANQQQTSNQAPWSSPNTSYAYNSITQAPSFGMRRIRY